MIYSENIKNVLEKYNTNYKTGLNSSEVLELSKKYGKNLLPEKNKVSFLTKFFRQFKDSTIICLIIAAVISFIVNITNSHDIFEPFLILVIVIVNSAIGVLQENKAERALEALKKMSSQNVKVLRDGVKKNIDSKELVPGDIVYLEAGDLVPADMRLLKSVNLKSDESALTGESVPVEKDSNLIIEKNSSIGDIKNMVFSGCNISNGNALGLVVNTGLKTEIGKIANLLNQEEETQTPLQKKLEVLGKNLGIIALIACVIIFVVGILNNINAMEILITSISLAVSAIPEGLPAIVTVILSIGVQRMVKKNTLIKKLPAVETLGSASVICSDKTGTLTQNRMTLTKIYTNKNKLIENISNNNSPDAKELLIYSVLCCDGNVIFENKNNNYTEKHIGDPTETSIIVAAHKNNLNKQELNNKFNRICEIPFDSNRKLMTTVNKINNKNIVIVKGAYDVLSSKCISGDFEHANRILLDMTDSALRVLAVAYKEIDYIPENLNSQELENLLENNLNFVGLLGMIDPPRPEVKESVKICKKAGIKPVMITGDHISTAKAIARELGILQGQDLAITGKELDNMSDSELDKLVTKISVYARVSPENKIRIVKAWQKNGQVVAMTGDGVNDAPALKAADIGCAMGVTGTDVAKGTADMILTDDNFATIVHAVKEGRGIYSNIKKVVGFLLSTNIGEVIAVFLSMLLWHKTPLISIQLLWINLVTDSLPAIALGTEPVEKDIMYQKPVKKHESIFANHLSTKIILQGFLFSILTLIAFKLGENYTNNNLKSAQTMAFMTLSLSQIIQAYNMRSNKSLLKIGIFKNKNLNWACLISILLVLLVLFTPIKNLFGLVSLSPELYIFSVLLICVPTTLIEICKLLKIY